ncbi:MAG TPA: pilin [Candidatus Paceibacterota bacterium]|nr:pilin [Candidatus Paceibacterota bacterium]
MKHIYRVLLLILLVSSASTLPGIAHADCVNPNSGAVLPNNSDGTCPAGFTATPNTTATSPAGNVRCQNAQGNDIPLPADGNCPANYPTKIGLTATGQVTTTVNGNLTYIPLEPLSSDANQAPRNFCDLLSLIFRAFIYVGGMIAVLYLVLGGISYMISEVVDKRSKARERIKAAAWGLIILLASWLILNTINPQLINACIVLAPANANGVLADPKVDSVTAARQLCQNSGGKIEKGSVNQIATDILAAQFVGPIGIAYTLIKGYLGGGLTETVPGTCENLTLSGRTSGCINIQPGEICITPIPSDKLTEDLCKQTGGAPISSCAGVVKWSSCIPIPNSSSSRQFCGYP